jgi:hypothetical protein
MGLAERIAKRASRREETVLLQQMRRRLVDGQQLR